MTTAVGLLRRLVQIDSVNPRLVEGGAGEAEIARFVAAWLEQAGLEVAVEEVEPGRPNVVGRARGRGGGRTLLLDAHTDTVGTEAMTDGLRPRIEGGRLYGRGSYDMKAGLAAAMICAARAAGLGLAGDVVVAAVVDEELASAGTERLVRTLRADAAVVPEPTELELVIAHKGFVGFELETHGRAAHGSMPELGVDAIAKMGGVLTGIEELDRALAVGPAHPLLGRGSVHASLIRGGQEFSSYPASCVLVGERRTLPGEDAGTIERELRGLVGPLEAADPAFHAELRLGVSRDPFELDRDDPLVQLVSSCASRVLGRPPTIAGRPFWTDAGLLAAAGIPTVLLGPGGAGAHAEVEWVELADVERLVEILTAVASAVCG